MGFLQRVINRLSLYGFQPADCDVRCTQKRCSIIDSGALQTLQSK